MAGLAGAFVSGALAGAFVSGTLAGAFASGTLAGAFADDLSDTLEVDLEEVSFSSSASPSSSVFSLSRAFRPPNPPSWEFPVPPFNSSNPAFPSLTDEAPRPTLNCPAIAPAAAANSPLVSVSPGSSIRPVCSLPGRLAARKAPKNRITAAAQITRRRFPLPDEPRDLPSPSASFMVMLSPNSRS